MSISKFTQFLVQVGWSDVTGIRYYQNMICLGNDDWQTLLFLERIHLIIFCITWLLCWFLKIESLLYYCFAIAYACSARIKKYTDIIHLIFVFKSRFSTITFFTSLRTSCARRGLGITSHSYLHSKVSLSLEGIRLAVIIIGAASAGCESTDDKN